MGYMGFLTPRLDTTQVIDEIGKKQPLSQQQRTAIVRGHALLNDMRELIAPGMGWRYTRMDAAAMAFSPDGKSLIVSDECHLPALYGSQHKIPGAVVTIQGDIALDAKSRPGIDLTINQSSPNGMDYIALDGRPTTDALEAVFILQALHQTSPLDLKAVRGNQTGRTLAHVLQKQCNY